MSHLPYYKINEDELKQGVVVPGELGDISLKGSVQLLVYDNDDLVKNLKKVVPEEQSIFITQIDARTVLGTIKEQEGDEDFVLHDNITDL